MHRVTETESVLLARAEEAEAALSHVASRLDEAERATGAVRRGYEERISRLVRSLERERREAAGLRELLSDVGRCAELGGPLGEELSQRVLEALKGEINE